MMDGHIVPESLDHLRTLQLEIEDQQRLLRLSWDAFHEEVNRATRRNLAWTYSMAVLGQILTNLLTSGASLRPGLKDLRHRARRLESALDAMRREKERLGKVLPPRSGRVGAETRWYGRARRSFAGELGLESVKETAKSAGEHALQAYRLSGSPDIRNVPFPQGLRQDYDRAVEEMAEAIERVLEEPGVQSILGGLSQGLELADLGSWVGKITERIGEAGEARRDRLCEQFAHEHARRATELSRLSRKVAMALESARLLDDLVRSSHREQPF